MDGWTAGWATRGPVLAAAALVLVLLTALVSGGHVRGLWSWTHHSWLQQQAVALLMNLLILGIVLAGLLYDGWSGVRDWRSLDPLLLFAVWVFSFLPGWLFVRFLGQRAGTLWAEYVEALHRLRMDSPGALPQPTRQSRYYASWKEAVGDAVPTRTLYQAKFDAYYGKDVARAAQLGTPGQDGSDRAQVRTDTLFPVFLATAVLAVGWTAVLRDTSFVTNPSTAADLVKFGFLGAYSFTVQMLMRRFFQSDLRASAYASATLRILTVTILVAVLYQLPGFRGEHMRDGAVVMFVIGFFPLVGMQALTRAAEIFLRTLVPSLNPAYPLNQVDGLNIWYESRLLEEGIEDMENLATADLVEVLLHTRVPVGRLVDWVDQVQLYQHLDRSELSRREARHARRRGERDGSTVRHVLRNCGVRTATDLLKAFPPDEVTPADMAWLREQGLNPQALFLIVQVLADEPALDPVWNWLEGGATASGERSRRREASAGRTGRAGSRAPRPA